MKNLIIFLLFFTLIGCTGYEKWSMHSKIALGAVVATQLIDGLQYERDKNNPNIIETNSRINDNNIWIFKTGTAILIFGIAHVLPDKLRPWVLWPSTVYMTTVVWNNEKVKKEADWLRDNK